MAAEPRRRVVIDFDDYLRYLTSLNTTTATAETPGLRAQRKLLNFLIASLNDFAETITDE